MSRGRDRRVAVAGAALALLCAAVYLPGLTNAFVWDDELIVTRNPAVSGGLGAGSVAWAFGTFLGGNWIPLTWLSHLADVSLFGLDPRGHHLTSLLIHAANAVLTLLLLHRATGGLWRSALVAALFAAHPLHVESVAWVAERKDVLSTFFWLLALLAWVARLRRPRRGPAVAPAVLFALALMAKPMPVTFPFLLLLLDLWPLGRWVPGRRAGLLVEKLPLFALAALGSAVAWVSQSAVGAVGSVPLPVRLANAAISCWRYVGRTLWPEGLALLYPFPAEAPPLAVPALAAIGLGAASAAALALRRRLPSLTVGWFWFLGTLVPVIGIVQIGTQAMADRYTYVPLTGLFVAAAWAPLPAALRARGAAPWLAAAATAVVVALAAKSVAQVALWRDPVTAFTNALRVTSGNALAHSLLSVALYERGDVRGAEEHARAAVAIAPDDANGHGSLALALERQGRIAEAIAEYRAAVAIAPHLAQARTNLGVLLAAAGEQAEAEAELRQVVTLAPDFAPARSSLGKLLALQGRLREALPQFREAVRLSPGTAVHHADLGAALAALGREEEALPELEQAVALDPALAIARENLAKARAARGVGR